jgi:2-polyprenyl-3-methyl-5-hydroxy-6-metoxy-1,4-benzoquinol methylase
VHGCDISATAIAYAHHRAAARHVHGHFFQHDVLTHDIPQRFDILTCSLFLHHLDDETAVTVLARLYAATRWLLIVCDLHRCRRGLALAWLGTRLLSRSTIVHVDGPRSVRAAFTRTEASRLASGARITAATVESIWPCRWRLVAERPS